MGVDKTLSSTFRTRKRGRPSKTDLKMSLVEKRLSMLQSDDDNDNYEEIQPVATEVPRKYESDSKQQVENNVKYLLCDNDNDGHFEASTDRQKICGSTDGDASDDSSSGKMKPTSSVYRRRHGSYKRLRVVSDDESSENREIVTVEPSKKRRQRRDSNHDLSENMDSPAMKRAREIQANLPAKYPSFVKLMSRSHVTQGFWLGLPMKFRSEHLPECDSTIVLMDEHGKEFNTRYLAQKSGLSGGWREFSIKHDLHEGDVVVFHLIKPTTFKIYIVRADNLGEVDGVLGLLNLDAHPTQWISEDHAEKVVNTEDSPIVIEDNIQGNSDIELVSEVVDGIHFSDTVITFEGIKNFESFNIVVDGLVIDSKFTDNIRKKYYELCSSQGKFLHERLLKGLNCSLVVGIISEIVNIADAIRAYNASTSHDDLRIWEQTLKGFELLGMNVSFLCERLIILLGLAADSDLIDEPVRFNEGRLEQAQTGERMKALEIKLSELKEMMEKIDLEMEAEIQASARRRDRIKEIANSAW